MRTNGIAGKRTLVFGLAAAGTAASAAVIGVALVNPSTAHSQAVTTTQAVAVPISTASTQPSAVAPTFAPVSQAQASAVAPILAPIGQAQASAIAVRASGGTVEEVDVSTQQGRLSYTVSVVHPDGSETRVVVDGRTGRVLSNIAEAQDSNSAEQQDAADVQDGQQDGQQDTGASEPAPSESADPSDGQ